MAFAARVILDSISPAGKRLITVEATYPRFIHSELMTHRAFARNAASSRAIPWRRHAPGDKYVLRDGALVGEFLPCMYQRIWQDPVIPIHFGMEQKGMQSADAELPLEKREEAERIILEMQRYCLGRADELANLGLHKSIVNRYVEPWMWITTLITGTEWANFFRLRDHPDAERHFQRIARMLRAGIDASTPKRLTQFEWHLPFISEEDEDAALARPERLVGKVAAIDILKRVSAARCARISYLTHDGRRSIAEDLALFAKLVERDDDVIHASPLEHVAEPLADPTEASGPFFGWRQFRKEFPNENVAG